MDRMSIENEPRPDGADPAARDSDGLASHGKPATREARAEHEDARKSQRIHGRHSIYHSIA